MFRSLLTIPLAGALLAGLSGCMESHTEPAATEPSMNPVAASVGTAAMTWYKKCDGCIMPSIEFNPNNPYDALMGWVYLFKNQVTPSHPIMQYSNDQYNLHKTYRPSEMGSLVDMDASYGTLYYLTAWENICVLNREPDDWGVLPRSPRGARRIGVNAHGNIAIVTNEKVPGGYRVQLYQGGAWVDIPGGVIDLDYDSNGDLWAVNESGHVCKLPANQPDWVYMGYANGFRISAGGGKVAVLTNVRGGGGYFLKRWVPGGITWQDLDGQMDHLNVDTQGRIWGSNSSSQIFYAALP